MCDVKKSVECDTPEVIQSRPHEELVLQTEILQYTHDKTFVEVSFCL